MTTHVALLPEAYRAEFVKLLDAAITQLTSVFSPDIFGGVPQTYNFNLMKVEEEVIQRNYIKDVVGWILGSMYLPTGLLTCGTHCHMHAGLT